MRTQTKKEEKPLLACNSSHRFRSAVKTALVAAAIYPAFVLLCVPVYAQEPVPTIQLENPSGITSFQQLFGDIVQWLTTLLVPVLAIIIIYGGFQMLTARDNEADFKKGKKTVTYAVIGAAVILVANGIILVIQSFLKVQ